MTVTGTVCVQPVSGTMCVQPMCVQPVTGTMCVQTGTMYVQPVTGTVCVQPVTGTMCVQYVTGILERIVTVTVTTSLGVQSSCVQIRQYFMLDYLYSSTSPHNKEVRGALMDEILESSGTKYSVDQITCKWF